jgi:hypothetical protein
LRRREGHWREADGGRGLQCAAPNPGPTISQADRSVLPAVKLNDYAIGPYRAAPYHNIYTKGAVTLSSFGEIYTAFSGSKLQTNYKPVYRSLW